MKPGLSRFYYFLNQLKSILLTATKQKNPALWLYRNNARTPLFMLEGLSKLYAGLHNEKKFTEIKEHLKLLEDTLGAIDYYDTAAKDLVNNKRIPASIINYLQAQSREKIQSLNEILLENDWLKPVNNRISKIQKKLQSADWKKERAEIRLIDEFYGESIYKIVEFTNETNYQFANLEADVHEIRRRLRWLSIYPHALRGIIQIEKTKVTPKHLTKYSTRETIASPYNKMPDAGQAKYILVLKQDHFYALSWIIAELGNLKDTGLQIIAVKEALLQTAGITEEAAFKKAYNLVGKQHKKLDELLDKASEICKVFFKEQNLEHMVVGIKKSNLTPLA